MALGIKHAMGRQLIFDKMQFLSILLVRTHFFLRWYGGFFEILNDEVVHKLAGILLALILMVELLVGIPCTRLRLLEDDADPISFQLLLVVQSGNRLQAQIQQRSLVGLSITWAHRWSCLQVLQILFGHLHVIFPESLLLLAHLLDVLEREHSLAGNRLYQVLELLKELFDLHLRNLLQIVALEDQSTLFLMLLIVKSWVCPWGHCWGLDLHR